MRTLKSLVLLTVVMSCCIVFGCQKSTVLNHADEPFSPSASFILERTAAPEITASYEEPSEYQAEFTNAETRVSVVFDAQVEIPQASHYSSVQVVPVSRSDEEIKKLFSYFSKGAALIHTPQLTKAQIENILNNVERERLVDGVYVANDFVKEMERMLLTAPEEATLLPFDFNTNQAGEPYSEGEEMECVFLNPETAQYAKLRHTKAGNRFVYCRYDKFILQTDEIVVSGNPFWGEPEGTTVQVENCAQEDAILTASQFIADMGLADFALDDVEAARIVNPDFNTIATTGWFCTFTRKIGVLGVHKTILGSSINPLNPPSNVAPWDWECVHVLVDQYGISFVEWNGASELQEETMGTVELLAFEEIVEKAKQQLSLVHGARRADSSTRLITVNRMRLGMSLLTVEGEPKRGQYVPTWYIDFTYVRDNSAALTFDDAFMLTAHEGKYVEPRLTPGDFAIMMQMP